MAAIPCHVATVAALTIDTSTNQPIDKSGPSGTIGQMKHTELRHVILPDATNTNTNSYPTIKEYILREAASGYELSYLGQTYIVTYERA